MRAGELPEAVLRFIVDRVDSVEQLEILLLLHRHPERAWNAESLARELRISAFSGGERLEDLMRAGLLARVDGSAHDFRYAPETPALDESVSGLATAYAKRRVTVINLIFSKPIDKIRTFADAFRLWKGDDNG